MATHLETLKQFEEDLEWITHHQEELKRQYPEEYVAIYKHQVVAHSSEMNKLMEELEKRYGELSKSIAIKYITPRKEEMILFGRADKD
jgi:hypothetical protein